MDHQCHSQYYQRTIPGYASVRGSATNTATVTVNSNPAWRHDDYFYGGDTADNSASALMKELEIVATHSNLYSAATGHVFVAQTPEQFIYDADGNLLSDGRWQYTWNGENRLIKAEELVSSTNRQPYAVYYAYDYRGRMAWKTIAPSTGPSIKTTTYVWDDYNIIAEHTTTADTTNTTYNVWGLDLSGTLQGAGGVGGLIAVAQSGTGGPPVVHTPANDANGNITEYVSEDGTLAAHYEYSPFGEIIAQSGDLASTFTHRFSTKPWCAVTGLSEYEFRKYSPSMGRWMNRDPLGEHGGFHLFLSLDNNVVNQLEVLGLLALGTVKERINKLTITCDFDVYICICVNCQSCEYYPLPGWKNIETVLQQEIERKKFVWNRNEAGKELFDQLKRGIINEALGKIIEAIAASLGIAYPNIPDVELLLACINYVKPPNNAFEDLQENGNYYEYLPSIVTAKTKLYKHYCQLPECNKKREGRIYGVATKCGDEIWVPGEWNAGVLY